MSYPNRLWLLPAIILVCFVLPVSFLGSPEISAGDAGPGETPTPTAIVPTPTPEFSATVRLSTDREWLEPGQLLQVTVDIDVIEGCQYPVYELTLEQIGEEPDLFEYISPPGPVVGPPVLIPFTYTLRALRPGMTVFVASTYGERYCNDYWNWLYLGGSSSPVFIGLEPEKTWIPMVAMMKN